MLSFSIQAQTKSPKISFAKNTHDFGTIKETDGKVSYKFEFVNTGNASLLLTSVNATCGCTTPNWTNTPILAGEKGYVEVIFNPQGYRSFTKSINVTTNGEPSQVQLLIKGTVEPAQAQANQAANYKYDINGIKFQSLHVGFGEIMREAESTKTIDILNSNTSVAKLEFTGLPAHIKVKSEPTEIAPNTSGKIIITYDAKLKNDWDYVHDVLFLKVNGASAGNNRINVSAVIKEDFSKMTADEKIKAPVAVFEKETFDFGDIAEAQKVDYAFKLKNSGKSMLIIRKISASCGCTAVMPQTTTIKPGETVDLKVVFDAANKKGPQNKSITVITNDPVNSRKVIWVRGNVLEPKQ
jgi:hypothetical protein